MWVDTGSRFNGAEPAPDEPPGDPFERGRDIVAAAMERFDSRVADTIFANNLNSLISSGRMSRDEAEAAIEENSNLAIEDIGYGEVTSLERDTVEHYVDYMVPGPIPWTLSCLVGIDSDVTTATIKYSAEPTADSHQQPKYGKFSGDDRGHITGEALGGPPLPGNLFSQHPSVNRGAYRDFENDIRRTLTEHKNWLAQIKVTLAYTPPQTKRCVIDAERERYFRPLGVQYSVSYTNQAGKAVGKPVSKWFSN